MFGQTMSYQTAESELEKFIAIEREKIDKALAQMDKMLLKAQKIVDARNLAIQTAMNENNKFFNSFSSVLAQAKLALAKNMIIFSNTMHEDSVIDKTEIERINTIAHQQNKTASEPLNTFLKNGDFAKAKKDFEDIVDNITLALHETADNLKNIVNHYNCFGIDTIEITLQDARKTQQEALLAEQKYQDNLALIPKEKQEEVDALLKNELDESLIIQQAIEIIIGSYETIQASRSDLLREKEKTAQAMKELKESRESTQKTLERRIDELNSNNADDEIDDLQPPTAALADSLQLTNDQRRREHREFLIKRNLAQELADTQQFLEKLMMKDTALQAQVESTNVSSLQFAVVTNKEDKSNITTNSNSHKQ